MGSKYSVGPFPKDIESFVNWDLVSQVKSKVYKYEKIADRKNDDSTFINRKQFQWVFDLSDDRAYQLFQIFDSEQYGYIPIFDLWGALVLAASAAPSEKISFLFQLMDMDYDQYMCILDCIMLIRCATRGFSRLKRVDEPPVRIIEKIVKECFAKAATSLNENGNIHLREFRAFMLVNDRPRTYFANLGTLIVVQDTARLIDQRGDLLKELYEIQTELKRIETRQSAIEESLNSFNVERGGDIKFISLTESLMIDVHQRGIKREQLQVRNSFNSEQNLRRMKRALKTDIDEPIQLAITDSNIFTSGNHSKKENRKQTATTFEMAFMYKWNLLCPQSTDKLVKLDLDTLLDLFEAAGIKLSDEEALLCLDSITQNDQGRYSAEDILLWFKIYSIDSKKKDIPFWRKFCFEVRESISSTLNNFTEVLLSILNQSKVAEEVLRTTKQNTLTGEEVDRDEFFNLNSAQHGFVDVNIKNSLRLSSWNRHQLIRTPCKIHVTGTFGFPNNKINNGQNKIRKNKAVSNDKELNWKSNLRITCAIKPDFKVRANFLDIDGVVRCLDKLEAADWLEIFNSMNRSSFQSQEADQVEVPFGTVITICFDVKTSASMEEAYLFLKVVTNFFESIPLDYRCGFYTHVRGQLFYIDVVEGTVPGCYLDQHTTVSYHSKAKGIDNKKQLPNPLAKGEFPRVICIGLLSKRDVFKNLEDKVINPRLFISRALRKLQVDLRLMQNFDDIYASSLQYEAFTEKLFGPQEDEIGEEGMNPLRFAKICRNRKKAAEDAIAAAPQMPTEAIKEHLCTRGLSDQGTRGELIKRVQKAFSRQAELVGYGELSAFGAELCRKLFAQYDEDKDGALSLFEINRLLFDTGTETIYDNREYGIFMKNEELHGNRYFQMSQEGLTAYYEVNGGLAEAVKKAGIGSLNQDLQGHLEMNLEYDRDAISSMLNILEDHSLAQNWLKKFISFLSSIKSYSNHGKYDTVVDLLKYVGLDKLYPFEYLVNNISVPGWPATFIHSLADWLADGQGGLIYEIRQNSKEYFQNYFSFESEFNNISISDQFNDDAAQSKNENLHISFPNNLSRKEFVEFMKIRQPGASANANKDEFHVDGANVDFVKEWNRKIDSILPPIMQDLPKEIPVKSEIANLLRVAAHLGKVLQSSERLTRQERDTLLKTKQDNEKLAESYASNLEKSIHLSAAHFIAFYDSLRLFGSGISTVCCGTEELSVRIIANNLNFTQFLPPGKGEPSIMTSQNVAKINRSSQRKTAALEALNREKLRRDLDEAEREKRRKWELANVQLVRDEEEKKLFGIAYAALLNARDEIPSQQELEEMLVDWRKLLKVRKIRYPNSLRFAVCQNNLACVLLEFFSSVPTSSGEALFLLRESSALTLKFLKSTLGLKDIVDFSMPYEYDSALKVNLNGVSPVVYLLFLINYLSCLKETKNNQELNEATCKEMREMVDLLLKLMTEKEKKTLTTERSFELITIFPYQDVDANIKLIQEDLHFQRVEAKKKKEQEDLTRRLIEHRKTTRGTMNRKEGFRMGDGEQAVGLDLLAIVDPKKARKIKFESTMKLVRGQRKRSVKQRQKMYNMIQSDSISTYFLAHAKKVRDDAHHEWGDDEGVGVDNPFDISDEEDDENVSNGDSNDRDSESRPIYQQSQIQDEKDEETKNKLNLEVHDDFKDQFPPVSIKSTSTSSVASVRQQNSPQDKSQFAPRISDQTISFLLNPSCGDNAPMECTQSNHYQLVALKDGGINYNYKLPKEKLRSEDYIIPQVVQQRTAPMNEQQKTSWFFRSQQKQMTDFYEANW